MNPIDDETRARRTVSDLIFSYRQTYGEDSRPLSYQRFAELLNEILEPHAIQLSRQTIKNWEDRRSLPRVLYPLHLSMDANDWRRDFAEDMLAALRPKLYRPATYMGLRAIERSLIDTGPRKPRYDPYYIPRTWHRPPQHLNNCTAPLTSTRCAVPRVMSIGRRSLGWWPSGDRTPPLRLSGPRLPPPPGSLSLNSA